MPKPRRATTDVRNVPVTAPRSPELARSLSSGSVVRRPRTRGPDPRATPMRGRRAPARAVARMRRTHKRRPASPPPQLLGWHRRTSSHTSGVRPGAVRRQRIARPTPTPPTARSCTRYSRFAHPTLHAPTPPSRGLRPPLRLPACPPALCRAWCGQPRGAAPPRRAAIHPLHQPPPAPVIRRTSSSRARHTPAQRPPRSAQ